MFTINQIKEAHSKVKSGSDFPKYVQEMKALGVTSYEHFVSDGQIQYYGSDHFKITGDVKWTPREIAANGDSEKLKAFLVIHQQGQTDYPAFCEQSAEAGVEKWIVDMIMMKCIYYDKAGDEMMVEAIPKL